MMRWFPTALFAATMLAGFTVPPTTAPDPPADALGGWLEGLPLDPRIANELAAFEGVAPEYADELAAAIRTRMAREVAVRIRELEENDAPEERIDVDFQEPGFATGHAPESDDLRDLEKSFIRTEAVAFFPGATMSAEDALRIYVSEDFRRRVSSRVSDIRDEGDLYCVDTKGVRLFLGPTKACSRIDELLLPLVCSQHSQVVSNSDDDDLQIVYFKESVKTFVHRPDGLLLHYLNYSRSRGMGGLAKRIGRAKLEGAQEKAIEELAIELGVERPED